MIQTKMFHNTNRKELEQRINQWLAENAMILLVSVQMTAVMIDQPDGYVVDHTVALFFVTR